jgi:hypothetical protein
LTHDLGELSETMLRYDEPALVRRLADLPEQARALFADAIAQRALALYELFAARSGQGDPAQLRAALDASWDEVAAPPDLDALAGWQAIAEELVPHDDDDDWVDESAYAQNGAAAVAYALRTRLGGDPQEAAWAARQLYEAADYAAQRQLPDLDINDARSADALLSTPIVQEALAGLNADLEAVGGELAPADLERLRFEARAGGERLAAMVP